MDSERLVQVMWEGPFTLEGALASSAAPRKGIYQIYGQHIVFGPNSLLYVGMTDGQNFALRLAQHRDRWLMYEDDVAVRLGIVTDLDSYPWLADIEALTIWWHSPPYNSKNIWTYSGKPLRIQNLGARGRLHPEYSSHWKLSRTAPDGECP
jgi:hypothetical protein